MPISKTGHDKPGHIPEAANEPAKVGHKKVTDQTKSMTGKLAPRKNENYIDHLNLSDTTLTKKLREPVPPRTPSPSEKENKLEQFKPQLRANLKQREAEKNLQILKEITIKAESGDVSAQLWLAKKSKTENNLDMAIKYYNMAGGHQNLEAQKALTQIFTEQYKDLSLDSLAEGIAFSLEGQHQEIVTKLLGELEERGKAGDPGSQQVFDAFIQIIMDEPTKS